MADLTFSNMVVSEVMQLVATRIHNEIDFDKDWASIATIHEGLAEVAIGGVEYQIQLVFTPKKEEWVEENMTAIRVDTPEEDK